MSSGGSLGATMSAREEISITAPEAATRWTGMAVVLTAALTLSVVMNVLLAHKVRSLLEAKSGAVAQRLLKVGEAVPPIEARLLGGNDQELLSYQGTNEPTVLYIFTPPCIWCARNMDNLKTLLDKERDHYRFIGLSLSEQGLEEYVGKNDMRIPVYSGLSPETVKTYKLRSTPQTIVISPEGKVLQDWAGAYVGDQKSQVEAFFHVSLPGLRESPKAEAAKN
jgi:hypothetical protein